MAFQGDDAAQIRETSARFTRRVVACTRQIAPAVEQYPSDSFGDYVERAAQLESDCDELLYDLRTLVGRRQSANFSGAFLLAAEVIELYTTFDDVADLTETGLRDLDAMGPDLDDPVRNALHEMARLTVEATELLAAATRTYTASLYQPGETIDVLNEVEEIRRLEGRCDERKRETLDRVFADGATVNALVVREVVDGLDDVVDVVEDTADELLYLTNRNV
jgi:uncharacterized protein Yka (UPF0111/DUF47 family)